MGLWIRSQDRRSLQKITKLYVEKYDIDGYYAIYDFPEECDEMDIGHYSSKERALEVLDEIQDLLMPKKIIRNTNLEPVIDDLVFRPIEQFETMPLSNDVVYEMPKE